MKRKANGEIGVDLNRNYDYKWGFDDEGSSTDPCDETYRGSKPFSEPETESIKNLVESSGRISSAMNFHSWGNLWITPYNYYKNSDYSKVMEPLVHDFYRDFQERIREMGYTKFGNGEETIQYVANGEASDWMLGVHRIISMSPELGDDRPDTDKFYPPKESIPQILDFDWPVVDLFFQRNQPIIQQIKYGYFKDRLDVKTFDNIRSLQKETEIPYQITFVNNGILDLYDVVAVFNFFDSKVGEKLSRISIEIGDQHVGLEFNKDSKNKIVTIPRGITVRKLSKFSIYMWMREEFEFEFAFRLLKNGREIVRITTYNANALIDLINKVQGKDSKNLYVALMALLTFAVFVAVIVFYAKYRRKMQEQHIIEIINTRSKPIIILAAED